MKLNQLTAALVTLGVVSLAGVAQASSNPVIYLTGSTAARTLIAKELLTAGAVFDSGSTPTIVSPSPNNVSGGQYEVVEGPINGTTVDIDCSWTGSEAGIAAVAGQTLSQNVNGGTYNLPGSPASFLTQASGWTTLAVNSTPDLSMADTSQAVSRTPESVYPLHNFGIVGIVTFTLMKGYEATPDQSWNDVKNVTTAEFNQNLTGPLTVNIYTGNSADADTVVVCGRNFGSGTRANCLLNMQYPILNNVDQWAYDSDYASSAGPGVLAFENNYAAGQSPVEIGNDGFDSGSGVSKVMQVDGTGSGIVMLGYLGISDALSAYNHTSGGGAPTYLPFNGVYEGDQSVINGNFNYWGQEHLYGQVSPSTEATTVGNKIVSGIASIMAATGGSVTDSTKAAGACTGDVSTNPKQSILIPTSLMQVTRATDSGFPTQGNTW